MEHEQLKAYTMRAKDLEVAIYTQKKLIDAYSEYVKSYKVAEPTKKKLSEPYAPQMPHRTNAKDILWCIAFGLLTIAGGVVFLLVLNPNDPSIFLALIEAAVTMFSGYMCYTRTTDAIEGIKGYDVAMESYQRNLENYQQRKEAYKEAVLKAEAAYQTDMAQYRLAVQDHNNRVASMTGKNESALQGLENALQKHYAEGVIYPKYRNLVAISSINEYLESGRCDKLEGGDGAYNLYEGELRQNIVIGQLSSIVSNLESIKTNQYALYEELQRANSTVEALLEEIVSIGEYTAATAYFSAITAAFS